LLKYLRLVDFNPLTLTYMLIRVSLKLLLGNETRNKILKATSSETLEKFLKRIHYPKHLSNVLLVKETRAKVQRGIFRHEPQVSSFLAGKKGAVFVDVGANVGYYSFLLYDNFDTILAVEPHPDNVEIMTAVKAEGNFSKVKISPCAVGDKDRDEVRLYVGSHCGGHTLLAQRSSPAPRNQQKYIKTRMMTLNTLLKDFESIDLVKVDVEGAEWSVLKGAENIRNRIKSWIIELHGLGRKQEMEKWFSDRNYRHKWIDRNHLYAERND
jgi:FkbM family methyltransferase